MSLGPRKWTGQSFPARDPVFLCKGHQAPQTFWKLSTVPLQCSWKRGGRSYVKGLEGPRMMLAEHEHSCSIISAHYVFLESMNDAWINIGCSPWEVCYSNFNNWVPASLLLSFMSLSLKRFLPWEFDASLVQSWGHLPRSDFGTPGSSARQRVDRVHRGAAQRLLPPASRFGDHHHPPAPGAWVHSLQRGLLWPRMAIYECVVPRSLRRKPTTRKILQRPEKSTGKRQRSCAEIWGERFLSASLGKQPDRLRGRTPEGGERDPRPRPF